MLNSIDKNKLIPTTSVIVITLNLSVKLELAQVTSNLSKLYVFLFKVLFESDYNNATKYGLL